METTEPTSRSTAARTALLLAFSVSLLAAPAARASYGWPVQPFHAQHPTRAYFGDPRIGADGRGGISRSLHFGVDISAPNGTPVYATISGTISRHPLHPSDAVLVTSGSATFEYWHVVPAVSSGHAVAYRTVLGRVEAPWLHVHFAERHGSTYVNPLRPGALAPFRDTTAPTVAALHVERANGYDISVEAYDTPPVAVPAPWSDKPVSPAIVEWRLGGGSWHVAADFRSALPRCSFTAVYAGGTTQNHPSTVGSYRFTLLQGWHPSDGTYVISVRVHDTAGNVGVRATRLAVR